MAKKINQEIYKRNRSFNKLECVINLFFNDKITRRGIAKGKYVFGRLKEYSWAEKNKEVLISDDVEEQYGCLLGKANYELCRQMYF